MNKEKNVEMLEEFITQASREMDMPSARELAVYLSDRMVIAVGEYLVGKTLIAAPVDIGQTVYCALPAEYNDGVAVVCSWQVQGIVYKADGRFYALDGGNEEYEIDSENCRLTYAEAEKDLKNAGNDNFASKEREEDDYE